MVVTMKFMQNRTNITPWTAQDDQFLLENRDSQTARHLADALKRTEKAITNRLYLLSQNPKKSQNARLNLVGVEEPAAQYWKRVATEAQRKLAAGQHDRTAVEQLVAAAHELAPKAYVPHSTFRPSFKSGKSSPQSAVLMLSDTHIGQVIQPDQTLGLGNYGFEIFLRRLARLERSVFSIVQDHTTTGVPEIVVAMLGDMLHGNLQHAVEAGQANTLFTQFYNAGHAVAQFLRNLSALAPVRVETAVGNHTRMPNQHKMPTDNRYSNFDQVFYAYVQALLRDCPRVSVNLTKQPFALFEVAGHAFFAGHGDHLKGGDAILGIPNHALGRNLSNTSQNFNAVGKKFPSYFMFGHFHRPITLPHANGEVLINGGFPGTDGYSLMSAFNSSKPSQKFFLMHPKFGKSASYDIRLDFGDTQPHNYSLPAGFECK